MVEDAAAILANNGFVTFTMAFFAHEGLPAVYTTEPIRLELFEGAMNYLKSLPYVRSNSIGAYGISKGGEISFAMASSFPDIKAAVNVNSTFYVAGTDYSYQGEIIVPGSGFDVSKLDIEGSDVRDVFFESHQVPAESFLPIENSEAELMYIAGCDDRCAPSDKSADFLEAKMSSLGRNNLEVLRFPGMGHLVDAPYQSVTLP